MGRYSFFTAREKITSLMFFLRGKSNTWSQELAVKWPHVYSVHSIQSVYSASDKMQRTFKFLLGKFPRIYTQTDSFHKSY